MNTNKKSYTSTIVVIVIIVLAVLVYFYYQGKAPAEGLVVEADPNTQMAAMQVSSLLAQVDMIHIDSTLFSDPGFQSLNDHTVAIPPQEVGRQNPFAPWAGAQVATTSVPRR